MAALMPQPFKFALAKGRGRYVCKLKLDRLQAMARRKKRAKTTCLPRKKPPPAPSAPARDRGAHPVLFHDGADAGQRRVGWRPRQPRYAARSRGVSPVAAEGASCTGKHCPAFSQCTYYDKRKELVGAQVIVANHDLLLSSLGARAA